MLKVIVYTFIAFSMTSCGLDTKYSGKRSISSVFSNTLFDGGRPLTDDDMAVAVRICFAYRAKRNSYSTGIIGEDFLFRVVKKECGNDSSSPRSVTSILAQGPSSLFFNTTYTGEFYPQVETDITGFLAPICSKVIQGDTPVNYYEKGGDAYEISFDSGLVDSYTVAIGQKESSSSANYKTVKNFLFEVVTNQAGSGKLNGLTSKVSRLTKCSKEVDGYSSFTRSYIDN